MKEKQPVTIAEQRRTPAFTKVSARTAVKLLGGPHSRRNWTGIRDELLKGERLFMPEAEFTKTNSKYLSLSLRRMGRTEQLHVRKVRMADVEGFLVWLDL